MSETSRSTVLHDRYELGEELGRGRMPGVYRPHGSLLDLDVRAMIRNQIGRGIKGCGMLLRDFGR